ncbi:hypothetical protein ACTFIR_012113 [Dictyostelium discoideum]
MVKLENQRLYFRELESSDDENLFELDSDQEVFIKQVLINYHNENNITIKRFLSFFTPSSQPTIDYTANKGNESRPGETKSIDFSQNNHQNNSLDEDESEIWLNQQTKVSTNSQQPLQLLK